LVNWFNVLGWPAIIRSDGGPQFNNVFSKWCQDNNIKHELSAPYNPRGNGLAEAAVKNIKFLLKKCAYSGEDPDRAIYEWRNVPRLDGFSPAQLFFGRRQFTKVPCHNSQFNYIDGEAAKEAKKKEKTVCPTLWNAMGVL